MQQEIQKAWLSNKGLLVLSIWGTALTSITLWAYFRKPYEKQIEKEIIVDLPHTQSTFNLKQHNEIKENKVDDENEMLLKIPSRSQLQSKSMFIDPISVSKLHKEQLWSLWLIKHRIFPSISASTTFYSLSLPLIMSIWYIFRGAVGKQNSILASYLTSKKWDKLFLGTVDLALYSIPASILGKLMSSITLKLGLSIRSTLVKYYENKYLSTSPYLLSYLMGNNQYFDQHITYDIDKFSQSCANLYNTILWSFGGVSVLSFSLIHKMGVKQFLFAIFYSYISRRIISYLSPSFTDITQRIQLNETKWRATHSKIAEYSEEISILNNNLSFSDQNKIEKSLLSNYYSHVESSLNDYYISTMITEMFGSYFTGEIGKLAGYFAMIPSIYYSTKKYNESIQSDGDVDVDGEDTVAYLTSVVQELTFLTKLFERVFRIRKLFDEVNGLSYRIYEIEKCINNVENIMKLQKQNRKQIIVSDFNECSIKLDNVTIETPINTICNGEILVSDLSIQIKQGQHMFIQGANGVGKTSIFRIIAGLWFPSNGIITISQLKEKNNIFFISQRPYLLPDSTIKQQICYPDDTCAYNDNEVINVLKFVNLYSLIYSRGGINNIHVFIKSGGEIQRIGMARCLLHQPIFALLDECSSAVSIDMKDKFFKQCIKKNITLITISHNDKLIKYHKLLLKLTKNDWNLTPINT